MNNFFKDFSDEQIEQFKAVFGDNAEYGDDRILLHQPNAMVEEVAFLTADGDIYIEFYEEESDYYETGGRVYRLEPIWWQKVNINEIFEDYKNNGEINPSEYSIYDE